MRMWKQELIRATVAAMFALAAACAALHDAAQKAPAVAHDAVKAATLGLLDARAKCAVYEAGPVQDPELDALCAALRGECSSQGGAAP